MNGLEAPDKLQVKILSEHPTNTKADRPKPMCDYLKNRTLQKSMLPAEKTEKKAEVNENGSRNEKSGAEKPILKNNTIKNNKKTVKEPKESQKLPTLSVRHVEKETTQEKIFFRSRSSEQSFSPEQKTR